MKQMSGPQMGRAQQVVNDIRRPAQRHFSAEKRIRIELEGVRYDESIAELCRREGIASSMYHSWSKKFHDAGERRLAVDTARVATSVVVKELRREAQALKEAVAELTLENCLPKKACSRRGRTTHEISRIKGVRYNPAGQGIVSAGTAHPG